ncbi:MAG: PIN domain-containing protein [Bryobacteraceae bacterium]
MTKVLIDTNVILDVLLDRHPHIIASAAVWAAVEAGRAEGVMAAHAVTNLYYLIRKDRGLTTANRMLSLILRVFGVATVDAAVIHDALNSTAPDFEDSVTASAAKLAGCVLIVTRDPKGFRGSAVPALAPEAATVLLAKT